MKKKDIIELTVIIIISLLVSITYNNYSGHTLPLLKAYKPTVEEPMISKEQLNSIEQIDIEVLKYLKEKKGTIILDARMSEEFKKGHIPGAYSFPVSEFDTMFKERGAFLKTGKTIITYCTGRKCTDSSILALKLKRNGIKDIFLYQGGITEWLQNGYTVEKSKK